MRPYAIIVEFVVKPGRLPAFEALIIANAKASVTQEPGCRRFDVLASRAAPDTIILYEIYDDEAAFEAHSRSPHYLAFAEASRDLVVGKTVTALDLVAAPQDAGP